LKTAAKQLVSFIFEWLAAENLWIHIFFRNFSENFSEKNLKIFCKIFDFFLKKFRNSSKFEKSNAKSLKIAAELPKVMKN